MTKKLLLILLLPFSTLMILSTSQPTYEFDQTYYSLEEIYELLIESFSENSPVIEHPYPDQYGNNTGYSYFLEKYKANINFNKKNTLEHEYLFKGGNIYAARLFRNALGDLKIVSTYEILDEPYQPAWFDGIVSEITSDILLDTFNETDGYMLFSYEEEDARKSSQYLFAGHNDNVYFYAEVSKDIIDPVLRKNIENQHLMENQIDINTNNKKDLINKETFRDAYDKFKIENNIIIASKNIDLLKYDVSIKSNSTTF